MKITTLDLGEYQSHLFSPGIGVWRYENKLPLTSDPGQLRLIAIGVGGAFSNRMYQSNFVVVKGNNVLFIDLGSKTSLKLTEFGLNTHNVRNLLITHSHADHIGSLEELALKRRYEAPFLEMPKGAEEPFPDYLKRMLDARAEGRFRPRLYVPEIYESTLWNWSLRGGLAYSEKTDEIDPPGEMNLRHYFKVVHPQAVNGRGRSCWRFTQEGDTPEDNIEVELFLTNHIPDSAANVDEAFFTTGFILDGRVLVSGDTKHDPEMVMEFGKDVEVIFHDCQHFPGGVHANYNQLKELPDELRNKMVLYHLSDGMLELDVVLDGFLGLMEPAPVVYDF